jgi:hypothetical protein
MIVGYGVVDRSSFDEHPDPNSVLRGGPLDGIRIRVHTWAPVTLNVGDDQRVYRPLGEMDTEYPTLAVYVFDAETTHPI